MKTARDDGDVKLLLTQGLEHYLNGRLREAASAWQQVLRIDPSNARAREYLRSALHEHGPLRKREAANQAAGAGRTAWDDGPAAAPSIELDGGASEDHFADFNTPPPLEARLPERQASELETLLRGARELYALNDFSSALELLDKILIIDAQHAEATRMREDCVETLIGMYESQLGGLQRVPELAVNPDEIIWLNLDHRAGFVLAQIDGGVTYDDLYAICGMSRLDTARILAQLQGEKVIRSR